MKKFGWIVFWIVIVVLLAGGTVYGLSKYADRTAGGPDAQLAMNPEGESGSASEEEVFFFETEESTEAVNEPTSNEPTSNEPTANGPTANEPTAEPESTEAPEPTSEPAVTPSQTSPTSSEPPSDSTEEPRQTSGAGDLSPLHLEGIQLCDEDGNPVQLKGVSTHGLAWFPEYVNEDLFKELHEEWDVNVIRLAMYTAENGGYCTDGDKDALKQLIDDGVQYATDQSMYVIIDWHILSDGNPNTYKSEAKDFFEEMSGKYADYTNVLYEICNEPNGGTSWRQVKSYAEEIIGVIRENDDDAIILVGTPSWCQEVDEAADDPITGYDNIMYTLHFYAATHRGELRKKLEDALEDGLPIFVSEFGICDASGGGGIDEGQADRWIKTLNKYGVSYVAWNLSNKNETAALFQNNCDRLSGFGGQDLTASGRWVYRTYTGENDLAHRPDDGNGDNNSGSGGENNDNSWDPRADEQGELVYKSGGLEVYMLLQGSWGAGSSTSFNYNLNVYNISGEDISDWSFDLVFNGDVSVENGWCGTFSEDGSTLHVEPADFNSTIMAGSVAQGVGVILTGDEDLEILK